MTSVQKIVMVVCNLSAPLGRILIALMFFMSGLNKLGGYEATAGWMESIGVPGTLLPLVIILEVIGGVAIIVGWKTRLVAFLFAGFCLLSAAIFHADFSDQTQLIMFMKNLAIAGGFLFLVANGAGSYSIDNRGLKNNR